MKDATYFLLLRILDRLIWDGTLHCAENLPEAGPAVFVANHLGPQGPIGAICAIRLRFYPWVIADMLDPPRAADYLRLDFVEPTLKLRPPLSALVAKAISLISVPLLTAIGGIRVDRKDYEDLQDTLQASVTLLKAGKIVLVFPEAPEMDADPQTGFRPFLKGFTRLGELFYEETGEILRFYPVAVHASKRVLVGKPVPFDPGNPRGLERHRLKDGLEAEIQEMFLVLSQGDEPWQRLLPC